MKRLLFIEDDRLVGRMYQCGLQLEGFQVEVAEDGEAGLASLSFSKPDLVILDLMLPKLGGVQVLNRIRSQPATTALPVIVLTNANAASSKMVDEARKAGANAFLNKSETTPPKLLQAVRTHLSPGNLPLDATEVSADHVPVTNLAVNKKPNPVQDFWENLPEVFEDLQRLSQEFLRTEEEIYRILLLSKLHQKVNFLAGASAVKEARAVRRMAAAFKPLLRELEDNPGKINPSTSRTVSQAVDFLGTLIKQAYHAPAGDPSTHYEVLVVDDDPLILQAVSHALEKAGLKCTAVQDPFVAYQTLENHNYDLAIIDVRMPGMDGFDLCQKIRLLPAHKLTPVVFLTRLNDFEHRVRSAKSGGNDFIGKPFIFIELAVKALIHVLRNRLEARHGLAPFTPLAST
jgi:DNA-binding response OmpR family regulator